MNMYLLCIYMKARIAKWGNSYALRIPKQVVDDLELSENSDLVLQIRENSFVISKISKEQQLHELLKNVKPQQALDWGPPRGKEVW